jgi:hypothetical protein
MVGNPVDGARALHETSVQRRVGRDERADVDDVG